MIHLRNAHILLATSIHLGFVSCVFNFVCVSFHSAEENLILLMLNYTLFFLARITKLVDEPNDLSFFNMIAVVGVAVLLYHLVQSIHIFIMEMQCVSDSRY